LGPEGRRFESCHPDYKQKGFQKWKPFCFSEKMESLAERGFAEFPVPVFWMLDFIVVLQLKPDSVAQLDRATAF
jgi:hypothetical protein